MWKVFTRWSYLIAFVLGVIFQLFFPASDTFYDSCLKFSSKFVSYALFPFLIGSIINGVPRLLEAKKLKKLFWKNLALIFASNLFFSVLAILVGIIYIPNKIKIVQQSLNNHTTTVYKDFFNVFPFDNALSVLFQAQINFFPFYLFLIFTGLSLYFTRDKVIVFREFLVATSRIFYRMNSFIVDIAFICFFFLAGNFILHLKILSVFTSFIPLLLYLSFLSFSIVFLIMPLVMRYFFGIKKCVFLFSSFKKTLLYSFLTADRIGALSFLIKETRENCLIPRRLSAIQTPLYSLFCRGGNAFVTIIAFLTLIRSYSSLTIGIDQIIGLGMYTFLCSFILLANKDVFFIGIGFLAAYYACNMQYAHLNLLPILMLLSGFSAFLDTLISSYFLVGVAKNDKIESHYLA